jgi:hypothetical protein
MDPNIWGPSAWKFLHTITLAYPSCPTTNDKNTMKAFFDSLQYVLPCHNCKDHFATNIKKHPLNDSILCSKEKLVKWLIDIHNEVNILNNKPQMTYNDFLIEYDNMYNNNNNTNNKYIYMVILILFIIIVTIFGIILFVNYKINKKFII